MRIRLLVFFPFAVTLTVAQTEVFPFVFLNPNPNKVDLPKDIVDSLQARHMRNITKLADDGKLLVAGPFYDGGGIFVFAENPVDSVRAWLGTDPAVRAQRWIIEFLAYTPLVGSICAVGKEHEMTTYGYVRVTDLPTGLESVQVKALLGRVGRNDTVVAAGAFPGSGSGIVMFRNAPTDSSIATSWNMKGIVGTLITRKLYIARGSFCE